MVCLTKYSYLSCTGLGKGGIKDGLAAVPPPPEAQYRGSAAEATSDITGLSPSKNFLATELMIVE